MTGALAALVETLVLVVHCLDLDRRGDLLAALRDEALHALHDAYRSGRHATDQATHCAVLNEIHLRKRAGREHLEVVRPWPVTTNRDNAGRDDAERSGRG